MNLRVAAVGFTCIDVYENPGNCRYATGNGVDVLINLCKRGVKGSVVSAVGKDEYGDLMLKTLSHYGIDTSHIAVVPDGKTAVIKMSLDGVDRVHGERIRGVMEGYSLRPGDLEFIQEHDIIHTDLSWNVAGQLAPMRKKGAKIFFDFSVKSNHPDVPEILKHISWGQFSFDSKTPEVEEFLKWAASFGPELVTATFGEAGALAYDNNRFYEQDIVPCSRVINTVGAGDGFASGFLYGIITGLDIPGCLKSGAETASKIVGQFEPY